MKKTCFFGLFLVTFVGLTLGLVVGTVSVFLLVPLTPKGLKGICFLCRCALLTARPQKTWNVFLVF